MAEMDNYTGSVPRKFIPLRLESASRQESTSEPTGAAQSGSGSLDIASLLKQDSPGGLLEKFLSDRSAERTDSETGSSIGHYASGVVNKCVRRNKTPSPTIVIVLPKISAVDFSDNESD